MQAIEVVKLHSLNPKQEVTFLDQFIRSQLPNHQPLRIPLSVLRQLDLCPNQKEVWAILGYVGQGWELLALKTEPDFNCLGVAIDLGSTTICFYFYDFKRQELIQQFSIANPQIKIAPDILDRLHFAKSKQNLNYVHQLTISAINQALSSIKANEIFYVSICGNTVMTHFLLNLPVQYIFQSPSFPCAREYDFFQGIELNLHVHFLAKVFVFPCAYKYFGGDVLAGLFYLDFLAQSNIQFFLDVGTNAEVVLGNKDFLLVTSGAAGPALEGGIFNCGMQAQPGAIYKIELDLKNKRVHFKVLGQENPKGFCGSAIIDLIAQLYQNNLLNYQGEFQSQLWPERFQSIQGEQAFIIFQENNYLIYLKQSEVKSFLRSKAAMTSILKVMVQKIGIDLEQISQFLVAGTFGQHINVHSAVSIGMLPPNALAKTKGLGNTAGLGALKFLQNPNLTQIKQILSHITFLDLNQDQKFMELLNQNKFFPMRQPSKLI